MNFLTGSAACWLARTSAPRRSSAGVRYASSACRRGLPTELPQAASWGRPASHRHARGPPLTQTTLTARQLYFPSATDLTRARFDFRRIRDDAEYIARNIRDRKSPGDVAAVVRLYEEHLALLARVDALRSGALLVG